MIQAKDLRFGNKVQNQKGNVITVQQILSNTVIYDTRMKVDAEMVNVSNSYAPVYSSQVIEIIDEADYTEIDPIPVTEDVLKRCGFRSFIREEWIISCGRSHLDFDLTDDGLKMKHAKPGLAIKYVHQLQNFYFAITGQELAVEM